jgi:CRISPR-associated protein Cmr2
MGNKATISFGIVIAHHSVPLALALENIWEAEAEAKEHISPDLPKKDAVQVRALYSNGNILKATCKFEVFHQWQLLMAIPNLDSAIFEQAATVWSQHSAPMYEAIAPWSQAFCSRREQLVNDSEGQFQQQLAEFLQALWRTTAEDKLAQEIYNWLKLAAFVIRKRQIN